jgi:bacterioferritin (cytochrome b1)
MKITKSYLKQIIKEELEEAETHGERFAKLQGHPGGPDTEWSINAPSIQKSFEKALNDKAFRENFKVFMQMSTEQREVILHDVLAVVSKQEAPYPKPDKEIEF